MLSLKEKPDKQRKKDASVEWGERKQRSRVSLRRQLSRSSGDLGHIKFCTLNDRAILKENDTDCFCF